VWLKEQICSGIDITRRIYLCTVGIRGVVERTDIFWYRSNPESISVYCRYMSVVERTAMFWDRSNPERISVYLGIRSVVEKTDMFRYRSNPENISVYCRYTECG